MGNKNTGDQLALNAALRSVISAMSGANITGEVDGHIKGNKIIVTAVGDFPAVEIRDALAFALNPTPELTIKGRSVIATFPLGD